MKEKKEENSIKKENLENCTIKVSKSSLHEKFKFLFISQGQVDTWEPLIGLLEHSKFTNMEFSIKLMLSHQLWPFGTKTIIFASLYEIQWSSRSIRELFGPFRMTMRNFCIFMQNQLPHIP